MTTNTPNVTCREIFIAERNHGPTCQLAPIFHRAILSSGKHGRSSYVLLFACSFGLCLVAGVRLELTTFWL